MRKTLLLFLSLPILTFAQNLPVDRPVPTHSDFRYGVHPRNKLDVWIPERSDDGFPFPAVIYFHGGGFVVGDKSEFDPQLFLDVGIACISANYEFVNGVDRLGIEPFFDAAHVVRTVRFNSAEWNLDPGRIALYGRSAGGVMALWVGLHDDMAQPDSDSPKLRSSTRVSAVIAHDSPTNLMPDWILKNIGGANHIHASFEKLFGKKIEDVLTPKTREMIKEISPCEFVSSDDPPVFLSYTDKLDDVPLPETASPWKVIHHPFFGKVLKEKLEQSGVEAGFQSDYDPRGRSDVVDWLRTKFGMLD